jgi:hypothetical protein
VTKRRFLLGVFIIFCITNSAVAFQSSIKSTLLIFQFRVSEMGNLAHQLDCVSGVNGFDSDSGYKKLWQSKLGLSKEDEAVLQDWRQLNRKYNADFKVQNEKDANPLKRPLNDAPVETIYIGHRLRVAAVLADNVEEFRTRLEVIIAPADVNRFIAVINHFYPRFHGWWQSGVEEQLIKKADNAARLIKENGLLEFCEDITKFYEAEIPAGYIFYLHMLAKPASNSMHSEQIENHSMLEVADMERPERQLRIVIHELCHHLHKLAPKAKHEKLLQTFLNANAAYALGLYNLLSETLPSAIGNGLVSKRLMKPEDFQKYFTREQSFYNDPFIDRAAKVLMPLMESRLKEKKSLYADDFVAEYLKAASDALGEAKESPVLQLRTMGAIYNRDRDDIFNRLNSRVYTNNAFSFQPLTDKEGWEFIEKNPELSFVILLLKNELSDLKSKEKLLGKTHLEQLNKLAKSNKAFVYAINRSPKARFYVFVADDNLALEALIEPFVKNQKVFEGVGIKL